MSAFVSALSTAAEAVSAIASLAFGATGGVVLGDFSFSGFEVPEYISIPGSQQLTVHKLPGGERVIDAMGDDPGDISWSGCIMDGDPWTRAQELEQMRSLGAPLPLQWGPFFYTVVIHSFAAKTLYSRTNYEISCTVLQNEATAPTEADPDLTDAVGDDMGSSVSALSIPSAFLGTAQSAISSVLAVPSELLATAEFAVSSALAIPATIIGEASFAVSAALAIPGEVLSTAQYAVGAVLAVPGAILGAAQASVGAIGSLVVGSPALAVASAQLGVVSSALDDAAIVAGDAIGAVTGAASLAAVTLSAGVTAVAIQTNAYVNRAIGNLAS